MDTPGDTKEEKPLILDEWLPYHLKKAEARDILELVETRNKMASIIFCSKYHTSEWHENLYDPTLADAIYNAYTTQIGGKSMRKGYHGMIPHMTAQYTSLRPSCTVSAEWVYHGAGGLTNSMGGCFAWSECRFDPASVF